jgi:hypothetical protein
MSHEIRKTTNCDSNTKGLSYGLLDYVFNLAAGRNIGLKMSKQNILFKANSLILMNLKKNNQWPRNPRKNTFRVSLLRPSGYAGQAGFRGSGFKVQRLQPLDIAHQIDQDPEH